MTSSASQSDSNAVYKERLQQAKRVLLGLSEQQRVGNFNLDIFARRSNSGVIACIAGHCGLDPWFQDRGFVTTVGSYFGDVSLMPEVFFGTARPFYRNYYPTKKSVTFDDAVTALDQAIARISSEPHEVAG